MLDFLLLYRWDFILILICLIVMFVLIKLGYEKQVKQMLLALVVKAERDYGGGTGQLKFSEVAVWVWERLPSIARIFLTAADIERLINSAVEEMKKYLEGNEQARAITEAPVLLTAEPLSTDDE